MLYVGFFFGREEFGELILLIKVKINKSSRDTNQIVEEQNR